MELFDKKFVHFMWDDSLKGKEGFVSDSIDSLETRVNDEILRTVDGQSIFGLVSYGNSGLPFSVGNFYYRFFYYDPLYDVKLAWKNGKQIQYKLKDSSEWWADCVVEPKWENHCEYRVKQEKKWRPFKDIAELKQNWLAKNGAKSKGDLYEPFIWIRDKERPDITRFITGFNGGSKSVALAGEWHILKALFEQYEFLDGTPCGVEEVE